MIHRQGVIRLAITALLLAALAITPLTTALAASVGDFGDVSGSNWYYNAVDFVVSRGLFLGTSATAFSPNAAMTRGMFITVLGRYANVDAVSWNTGAYHSFSDVSADKYYAGYAVWAFERGVVTGDGSSSTFNPSGNITRQEVCTMLSRFASVMGVGLSQSGGGSTFTDDGSISSWAKDSVYAMQRSGVVQGDEKGAFNPRAPITRAETAAMIQRFDSACGGFSAPVQQPSASSGSEAAPPGIDAETPLDPYSVPDTPATLIGGTVSLPATVIRVGLADMVTTGTFTSGVTTLSLQDVGGAGFEYGYMNGRSFASAGVTASDSITVTTDGYTFTATDSYGNVYSLSGDAFAVRPMSGATRVNGDKSYRGCIEMRQASGMPGYISVINFVDIEDFVKGVLPNEFGSYWPLETLKAGAVASRTHIMSSVSSGAYAAYGMDVVANDGSQFYRGQTTDGSSTSDQAVDATAGQYLTYGGSLCVTSYSACNGGTIRSSAEAGWGERPYLVSKSDPYEAAVAGEIGDWAGRASASHRVGMSQWGAYSMAKVYGKTYDVILGFYFPGTNLQYGA